MQDTLQNTTSDNVSVIIEVVGGLFLVFWVIPAVRDTLRGGIWMLRQIPGWPKKRSARSARYVAPTYPKSMIRKHGSIKSWLFRSKTYEYHGRLFYNHRGRKLAAGTSLESLISANNKKFLPWRESFWLALAFALFGCGVIVLSVYLCIRQQSYFFLLMGVIAAVSLFWGDDYFVVGRKRKRGKVIEVSACNKFKKVSPEEWDVIAGGYIKWVGDIDLLIRFPTEELCTVEIKSWQRWSGGARKTLAITQVYRQLKALNAAYPVLWLPHSPKAFTANSRGVLIVGGSAKFLSRELDKIIRYPAVIKFPSAPPKSTLDFVKSYGFTYDPHGKLWNGRCMVSEKKSISERLWLAGGSIEIDMI